MELIIFHAKRRWYSVLIVPAIMVLLLVIQKTEFLHAQVGAMDITLAAILGFVTCFTISNPSELELCKCYGFRPSRIMTAQILPTYLSGAIGSGLTMLFFEYFWQEAAAQTRILLAVSAVISLTFMVAANALFRVFARNTYIVVFLNMVTLFLPMYNFHQSTLLLKEFKYRILFDIAMSGEVFDARLYHVDMIWWIVNRVIFLALAVVFYIAACRLADRRSFEDFK